MNIGPSRGELWFRLAAGLAGTAAVIAAVVFKGVSGIASVEVVVIAGAFFGGSAVWSAWRLWRD